MDTCKRLSEELVFRRQQASDKLTNIVIDHPILVGQADKTAAWLGIELSDWLTIAGGIISAAVTVFAAWAAVKASSPARRNA
ncbi:hypothetical protein FJM67_15920 [Maribrevibacterium harenarium]|uniref:Uncharacterized protein n=1 Tax=Maribrevibacterium harenarium TaxID=2589817 RepID=A0A501WCL5_9GAMM|nr:hypothetical protein [Maribrevibacterium harenarium]TPE46562.1 hypothetical protein FJM67_15920 [Maribrevibacterium harenarium]